MVFFTITLYKLILSPSLLLELSALNDNQNSEDCLLEGVNPIVAMLVGSNLTWTHSTTSEYCFFSLSGHLLCHAFFSCFFF